jgi:glycosyltransferase involved in cell wall biosynthesis
MMKISVVVPTFNRAYTLKRCLDSILSQSLPALEVLVVDDGSTDETGKLLATYQEKISVFKIENSGVSAARNFAIKRAKGDWIALLDSDDEWLLDRLERQASLLKLFPTLKLIHGEEIWIRNGKRVNQKKIHKKGGGYIYQNCLPLCCISPSASLIKKEVLEEVNYFDETFPVCEDYDLWLKITSKYEVGFVPEPIIKKYGGHEDQLSRKYFAMDLWRVRSMVRMLDQNLQTDDREATILEIIRKSEILILGYKKHNNLDDLSEVESYLLLAETSKLELS